MTESLPVPDDLATLSIYSALCGVLGSKMPVPGVDPQRYDEARRIRQTLAANGLHLSYRPLEP